MKNIYFVIIIFFCTLFFSCNNIVEENPSTEGVLIISFSNSISRTLTPPLVMNPTIYDISGIKTGGETFEVLGLTETSTNAIHVTAGEWTITAMAKNNSGSIIGSGLSDVILGIGETKAVNITVEPLVGSGELSLSATLPEGLIATPTIEGFLTPADGATSIDFTFSIESDGLSGSYNHSSLATGYYTLALTLKDGEIEKSSAVETVRIVKDQITTGDFIFSYDPSLGEITVDVIVNIQNPITFSISGNESTIPEGSSMTVTAVTSETVESYQWYLNGTKLTGTTNILTIGSTLVIGNYRIDILAVSGSKVSSDYFTFSVVMAEVEAPIFEPIPGDVPSGTQVTMTSPTIGAEIRYTIGDGTQEEPTSTTGIIYNESNKPLLNDSKIIKAKAYKDGMTPSILSTANYTVVKNAITYVSKTGSDTNPGTADLPKLTIQAGIDSALIEVHIAAGSYEILNMEGLQMKEGVSIKGGYSATNWNDRLYQTKSDRENLIYQAKIFYNGSFLGGGEIGYTRVILASGSGILTNHLIEGLFIENIEVNIDSYTSAIICTDGASPTIEYNTINVTSNGRAYAVQNDNTPSLILLNNYIKSSDWAVKTEHNDSPNGIIIKNNWIESDQGIAVNSGNASIDNNSIISTDVGISIQGGSEISVIKNNLISVMDNTSYSFGIINSSVANIIFNNVIEVSGSESLTVVGINSRYSADLRIMNNTIFTMGTSSETYGIRIESNTYGYPFILNNCISTSNSNSYNILEAGMGNPQQLINNNLFGSTNIYYDSDGWGVLSLITDINDSNKTTQGLSNTSVGNISEDVSFVDTSIGDFHLSNLTSTTISQGGLDLSSEFTKDKDGNLRTGPWSIGAYEKD